MKTLLTNCAIDAINDAKKAIDTLSDHEQFIVDVAERIAFAFSSGKKVLIAGNGGSLCDATHFAEELTGFFGKQRRALPVIPLTDPGHITCTANDIGFEYVFSRGVEAYGTAGDVFIGLTTSGNSKNIVCAFEKAKELGLVTVAFLGKHGGALLGSADFEMLVPWHTSDRVQEVHMAAMHIIIQLIEEKLFFGTE